MKKYPLIGLVIGFLIGLLVSLFVFFITHSRINLELMIRASLSCMIGGAVIGIWIGTWKKAKTKAKPEESFAEIKHISELSSYQRGSLLRLGKLQKRWALILIAVSPLGIIFWLLYKYLNLFAFSKLVDTAAIILPLIGILVFFKAFLPMRRLQFRLGAEGLSAFPKYLPVSKIAFKFILLGEGILFILGFGCIFSRNYIFTLLIISAMFFYGGIIFYIMSRKNEKVLSKK